MPCVVRKMSDYEAVQLMKDSNKQRKLIESDYYKLRDEVKEAEQIRKTIYSIVRAEQQRTQPHRAHDIDL